MSWVWWENTYSAEKTEMKNLLLCHDEKCNNVLDICCGLKTKVYCALGQMFPPVLVIGATTLPVAVNQVFLHFGVCFGFNGSMLCWKVMYRQPVLQGFILLYVVN